MKKKGWLILIVLTCIIFSGAFLPIYIMGGFENLKTLPQEIYWIWLIIFIVCAIIVGMGGLVLALIVLWVVYFILEWVAEKLFSPVSRYLENLYTNSSFYKNEIRQQKAYDLVLQAEKIEKERKYAFKVKKVVSDSKAFYKQFKNIQSNLSIPKPLKYGKRSLIYIPAEYLIESQKANITCFYCPKPEKVYTYNDRKKFDKMQVLPSVSYFIRDHVNASQSQIRDYLNYQITRLGFQRFVSF